jgi:cytochrome c oxidase cbb3-type subunit 3
MLPSSLGETQQGDTFVMKFLSTRMLLAASCPAVMAFLLVPGICAQNPARPRPARPPSSVGSQGPMPEHAKYTAPQIHGGEVLFLQNCAFCHGKDAGGGESGPDLTRSKLVSSDKEGEAIGVVVRNGRTDKGMPRFNLLDAEIVDLVAFIHSQQDKAMSQTGTRKGVEESDLHTGNAEAGKLYFDGPGGCTKCHSPMSLAGVATRYTGLRLEQQMLYPRDVKSKVTVTTRNGRTWTGTLEYQDEFTIGLKDATGVYFSWPVDTIRFQVERPVEAHVTAMIKYTDDDIHNVLAYIQTLK